MRWCVEVALATLSACVLFYLVTACNEHVCASDVSKCQLLGSCSCDMKNCSCCGNCTRCLGGLWSECCSCMGLCPRRNHSNQGSSKHSTVANLMQIPSLFDALTETDNIIDPRIKWNVFRITHEEEDVKHYRPASPAVDKYSGKKTGIDTVDAANSTVAEDDVDEAACVIVYMDECLSLDKCELACTSMGATRQRWFHDGCCECVGHTCMAYGKPVSQCKRCPLTG
ncbi:twisted gastrulation protein homolog 1-A-like [Amphiura filiformis]|uniref:twisted gastrulation protein homolog 1-A-like n=1 Tax=Amphiura filiformis TaxID=82378 RepID=UPI003B20E3D9